MQNGRLSKQTDSRGKKQWWLLGQGGGVCVRGSEAEVEMEEVEGRDEDKNKIGKLKKKAREEVWSHGVRQCHTEESNSDT